MKYSCTKKERYEAEMVWSANQSISKCQIHFSKSKCYFIIGLQDRYGIGGCSGAAQFTMDEVWFRPNWQLYLDRI